MENQATTRKGWTRQQLLVAFNLYCQIPFGKMHSRNPMIVKCAELIGRTPSALAMKMTNIASLDPEITKTGRKGLDGASAADRAMWQYMQSDWDRFAIESQKAVDEFGFDNESNVDIGDAAFSDEKANYTGNDKSVQSTVRLGQSFFRRSVLSAYKYQCCITGLSLPKLLVASHIVPWHVDVENRLNPRNGLCLSMLHDKAFDAGIITISTDMKVSVSRKYMDEADKFFNSTLSVFDGRSIAFPEKFVPQQDFLAFHRENIFED